MKKIATVVLVLALVLGMVAGCATVKEWVGIATDKVCNFSVEDSAEAQAAKKFVVATAGVVGLVLSTVTVAGVKIEMTETKAGEIFDSVTKAAQAGSCVALQDLQAALAYFDQVQNALAAKSKVKAVSFAPKLISLRIKAK